MKRRIGEVSLRQCCIMDRSSVDMALTIKDIEQEAYNKLPRDYRCMKPGYPMMSGPDSCRLLQ